MSAKYSLIAIFVICILPFLSLGHIKKGPKIK